MFGPQKVKHVYLTGRSAFRDGQAFDFYYLYGFESGSRVIGTKIFRSAPSIRSSTGFKATGAFQVRGGFMKYCMVWLLLLSPAALAADWKGIEGSYAVTPEHYLDPAEEEVKDSHYRIRLQGEAARDLYNAMKSKPAPDECTGGTAKTQGEMRCIFHAQEKSYECDFSINISEQKIEYGVAC